MQVRQVVPKPVRKAQVQKEDLDAKEYQEIQALVGSELQLVLLKETPAQILKANNGSVPVCYSSHQSTAQQDTGKYRTSLASAANLWTQTLLHSSQF